MTGAIIDPDRMDRELSEQEFNQLIDASVAAIYDRGYNDALEHVIHAFAEGNSSEDVEEWIRGMRKPCLTSSSERQ